MNIVLDAGAMIAYLRGEVGEDIVSAYLEDTRVKTYAHSMNLIEVFYEYSRSDDVLVARRVLDGLGGDGITTRDDLDSAFCEDAAQLKADWKRVSLADCRGVALARRLNAEFLTTDRHELEKLAAADAARIVFLR